MPKDEDGKTTQNIQNNADDPLLSLVLSFGDT